MPVTGKNYVRKNLDLRNSDNLQSAGTQLAHFYTHPSYGIIFQGRLASVMGNHLTTSHKLPQDDNVEIDYESEHGR